MKIALRILLLAFVALILIYAPVAKADTFVVYPPGWYENGVGPFNQLAMFMITPGLTFSPGGGFFALSSYWSAYTGGVINPGYAYALGAYVTLEDFNFAVVGASLPADFSFYFFALDGATVVDSGIVTIYTNGNGGMDHFTWTPLDPDTYNTMDTSAVPEPMTLLLFGSGLMGIGGLVRRKLLA